MTRKLYRTSLSLYHADIPLCLFTDRYSLTMPQAYLKAGDHNREAVFYLFFRNHPFAGAGYSIAGGIDYVAEWLSSLKFSEQSLTYLSHQVNSDNSPVFTDAFLKLLSDFEFCCDLEAIPEGTVVGPHMPLVRGRGPVWQLQLIEGALLNFINRQTAVMTRAARIIYAAGDNPVSDQSLRRAPGVDGGLSDTLACYKAGFTSTSNELASYLFGIPAAGTMAHSYVMFYDDEIQAFLNFAEAFPGNALFLVDTYDTIQGIEHAAIVANQLKRRGVKTIGIRIDSGDLAYLSINARKILDEANLSEVKIFGSNALNEYSIDSIKKQGGQIVCWGVGEQIAGTPPVSGVWKIGAVKNEDGSWKRMCKVTSAISKATNPGILGVRRFFFPDGRFMADCIYDTEFGLEETPIIHNPTDIFSQKNIPSGTYSEDILIPVFRNGKQVTPTPAIEAVRQRVKSQLAGLHETTKRLDNAHPYVIGISPQIFNLRTEIIFEHKRLTIPGFFSGENNSRK